MSHNKVWQLYSVTLCLHSTLAVHELINHCKAMQEGKKLPKLTDILESDDEPEPDVVLEVPLKKVKLVVGPGGEKIKVIERKSKARLQVRASACLYS